MEKRKLFRVTVFMLPLLLSSLWAFSQTIKVTGIVTDVAGQPLPGVNITVVGTTDGTISSLEGAYSLNVDAGAEIEFKFIGYITQKIAVSDQTTIIDVIMEEDLLNLDEVVVIGYGTAKKSDITGSITSVDAEKLSDVPTADVTRALQGKVAGVSIESHSRTPGGNVQIRIRGERSLSGKNDPLIVVDGIPYEQGSLNDIPANDIESIEILKDASATVIYGSRGANGVILITTKRGKAGAVKISYNGYYGITQVARKYDLYDAEGFIKLRSVANNTNYTSDEIASMLSGRETDWQDLMYQNGHTTNHEIIVSGGTEKTQYSFSGGFYNETSILPGIGFKRYNMRVAIDQKINDRIKIGFTSMNSVSLTEGAGNSGVYNILAMSPLASPYNADGTLNERPMYPNEDYYNPLKIQDRSDWDEKNRRVASFNSLFLEVNIIEGLKYRLNAGYDFSQEKYNSFYGSNTARRNLSNNTAEIRNNDHQGYTIENLIIYDKTIADDHRLNFTGMQSIQKDISTRSRFTAEEIPADYLMYNNLSLAQTIEAEDDWGNSYGEWSLVSFMGRVNYAYSDRYNLTLTARADGSSRLAPGNKWHYYPAVAVAWNIANESFMENFEFLSNLKLRYGFGQTSNTAIDPYSTLGALGSSQYNFTNGVNGYNVYKLPNPNLGWEYTTTHNLGLDFGFLRGRIFGSVDIYKQKVSDLLLAKSLPPSQGVAGDYLENIGEVENKGIEIVLNGVPFKAATEGGFNWEISTNISINKNKIVALQDASITQDPGNGWFVGYPITSLYDYQKLGIWQLDEADEAATYESEPGDIKLKDQNGDFVIDESDRIIRSTEPELTGGFSSTWSYKGFDLSVVGYFKIGGLLVSSLHMPSNYFNRLDGRRNQIVVDYWTEDNPTNAYPKPDQAFDATNTNVLGYFDATFLKIRSINLGYNVDSKFTRFLGPNSSVRVYASITDPFIFFSPYLKENGVDPEATGEAQYDVGGLGDVPDRIWTIGTVMPPTRKIIFGINVKF